ncbi:MAG: hypothetical protein DMD63_09365 [Gemmatimonadetes bacterium]|nr:MAG: hypothetical protein DMD63_09365 [Gemmatimonadota bacterium]
MAKVNDPIRNPRDLAAEQFSRSYYERRARMRDQISNSCIVEFFDPPNPDDHMVTPLSNGVR